MTKYIVNSEQVKVGKITGREIRDLINEKTVQTKAISLRITDVFPKQTTYPGHVHTECEEIIFVMRGHGEIKIADEVFPMRPGDAIYLPQGVKHLMRNTGEETMRLICTFTSSDMSRDLRSEKSMDF